MQPIAALPEEAELLDRSTLSFAESEGSLVELDRVNRWFFGALPLRRTLLPRLAAGPARMLDLGTGTGRVAHSLVQAAARKGSRLSLVGIDRKLKHLVVGRARGVPQRRVVADARALPFRDASFAWSFSTLFFHHFDRETNRAILAEMRRVAASGAAVVDLRRSRLARCLLNLAFPLLRAGPITRHDGRVSLQRASTLAEVRQAVAGLPVFELRRRFPFRFSLVM
jgi:SAM-dependent methyltransferase